MTEITVFHPNTKHGDVGCINNGKRQTVDVTPPKAVVSIISWLTSDINARHNIMPFCDICGVRYIRDANHVPRDGFAVNKGYKNA